MIKLWYLKESKPDLKNYKNRLFHSTKFLLQISHEIHLYIVTIMLLIFDLELLYNNE